MNRLILKKHYDDYYDIIQELNTYMKTNCINKSWLAREIGINRITFYKLLEGRKKYSHALALVLHYFGYPLYYNDGYTTE